MASRRPSNSKPRSSPPRKTSAKPKPSRPSTIQLPADLLGLDVRSLLFGGIERGIAEGDKLEATKKGIMRGGSQGLYVGGEVVSQCHRAALARMLGGSAPKPADWNEKHIMFDSGHANEDSWVKNLERTWVADGGVILREEECPVAWEVTAPDGTVHKGSGRPDIVLCRKVKERIGDAAPVEKLVRVQGIELKQISSINSAFDVLFESGKPKLDHLCQAGRYAKEMGYLAWQIWYTLPFVLPIPNWSFLKQKIPTRDSKYAARVDFSPHTGEATKVQPQAVGYHIAWHSGVLHYCRVGDEEAGWTPTVVTEDGLDNFWMLALDLEGMKDLGPRPTVRDAHGERGHFNPCDYCDWQPTCDENEDDFDAWKEAVEGTVPAAATDLDQK